MAPAHTTMLNTEVARACQAHHDLVQSVRVLVRLPGNRQLGPHWLVRDLLEEVDWEETTGKDPELTHQAIDELERIARVWARVVPDNDKVQFRSVVRRLVGG